MEIKRKIDHRLVLQVRDIWFGMPKYRRDRDVIISWCIDKLKSPKDKRGKPLAYYKRVGEMFSSLPQETIDLIVSDRYKFLYKKYKHFWR